MVAILEDSSPQGHLFSASKIIEDHAFSLLLETALFTLYTALIVYLIYYVCASRKTTESLPSLVLVYTLSMFALYSFYWALDVYYLWAEYRSLLASQSENFDKPDIQKSWKAAAWILEDGLLPQYFVVLYMQYMVGLILIALGDFVSLWRAYAVWGRPRWLYITLGCVAVVEGVLYILICASSYTEYISSSVSVPNGVWALAVARIPLTFIGYASTALAQTASTTLMAYKAWFHWREVREFMNRSTSPSLTALAVVIESGVAYLLLLVWYGAITYFGPPDSLLTYTCRFYCAPLIAMYPTSVVVLVISRRSVLERSAASGATATNEIPARFKSVRAGGHEFSSMVYARQIGQSDTTPNNSAGDDEFGIGANRSMQSTSIVTAPKDEEAQIYDEQSRSEPSLDRTTMQ